MIPIEFKKSMLERGLLRFAPLVLASKDPAMFVHYQVLREIVASLESEDALEADDESGVEEES